MKRCVEVPTCGEGGRLLADWYRRYIHICAVIQRSRMKKIVVVTIDPIRYRRAAALSPGDRSSIFSRATATSAPAISPTIYPATSIPELFRFIGWSTRTRPVTTVGGIMATAMATPAMTSVVPLLNASAAANPKKTAIGL